MRAVLDREGEAGCRDLEEAWSSPETFAFLPFRSGGHQPWVERMLGQAPVAVQENHFALLSSGSTGEPKLVFGSRARAEGLARLLHAVQASESVHQSIGLLPLTYSYAFVNQWLWSRMHGRAYVPTPGFLDPAASAAALSRSENAMVCLVAGQLPLLDRNFGQRSFPGVSRLHFAGSRFPQERLGEIRRMFPSAAIYNNYGCIEAMPRLTVRRAEDGDTSSDIGRPLPGVELRAGTDGKLFFRSPYSAVGFADPGGFHAIGPDDWVFTGDCARPGPDGRWFLEGRASEVFKRFGVKISLPMLLDTLLASWRGQGTFYCESDGLGETGHVLLLAPAPSEKELRSILGMLRRDFARTHWPLRIESVPELPILPNGKVDSSAARVMIARHVEWSQRLG